MKRVNFTILGIGLMFTTIMVVILASGFGNDPHAIRTVLEGRPAPTFNLQSLEDETFDFAALKGKPVVLNFWSTWCGPCKWEHPMLQTAALQNRDVQFLGIIYSDDPELARRYLRTAGAEYPHLVDPGGRTAISYGVAGVPETFFIDTTGMIIHKSAGPLNDQALAAYLRSLRGSQ